MDWFSLYISFTFSKSRLCHESDFVAVLRLDEAQTNYIFENKGSFYFYTPWIFKTELSKVHKILKIEFVKKCLRNLFHVLKKLRLIKVRENPHVTAEEWTWIKNLNRSYSRQQDLYTSRSTQRSGRSLETSDHQMSPTTNFLVGEAEDDFIHDSGKFYVF